MAKIKIALIGAGMRGLNYINYVHKHRMEAELVAVADPNQARRNKVREMFELDETVCFESWEELLAGPKRADAVFICTQDQLHVAPTLRALEAGYHVMLEKPMATDPGDCVQVVQAADKYERMLVICHVLRYTPFFQTLKRLLDENAIGELVTVQHNENVGFLHQAHSYVRGNWSVTANSSPMILSKSSHDLDIISWLIGAECVNLSSFGSLSYFKAKNAPAGATERCLDGCPAADECEYYAPNQYLTENLKWWSYAISDDWSYEGRLKALQEGPYGRCVFHCDNDVVDHQVVNMEFANDVTASFIMSAFTNEISRTIKLMGTKGEIRAAMEKDEIEIHRFDTGFKETITLNKSDGHIGHGGGDGGIVKDFLKLLRTDASSSLTSAEVSLQSHLMAFAAENSRLTKQVVNLRDYRRQIEDKLSE
ncbi:oxidoreductase [Paenibacillus pectinilyticus]|uniref:Oxidoreductase n=1 Tax=Paenibacillus pectinilyticus TaxID=512399 RepID=A0A1C1A587_9BACL|nr:Gfo/Idh/MocA family oxidoreductase [Paenibacillus pectinilyticus]OCT15717.1 oxidoreductase [Paenibacillus pectinilyticus]